MAWTYAVDTCTLMCECDYCKRRMPMSYYQDKNYYLYCPYCGQRNLLVPDDIEERQRKAHEEG